MKKLLLFALSAMLFAACGDDEKPGIIDFGRPDPGVFVCCEGGYGHDNASLYYYDIETGNVDEDVYMSANGLPAGDVLQSMTIINGTGYLAVTQSDKVIAIDPVTFKHKGLITTVAGPRYIAAAGNKLYISSSGSQNVTVAKQSPFEVSGTIDLGREGDKVNTSEQIIIHNGYLYTNMWNYGDQLFKVDIATNEVVKTLRVAYQPNSMVMDKNNKLWLLSGGEWDGSIPAALTRVDPVEMKIETSFEFDGVHGAPTKLCINGDGDMLYYLRSVWAGDSGVYTMSINAGSLPGTPVIHGKKTSFYALGVDPDNSDIYVGNPVDFTQSGIVYHYNPAGSELKRSFKVGIGPGSFCFK